MALQEKVCEDFVNKHLQFPGDKKVFALGEKRPRDESEIPEKQEPPKENLGKGKGKGKGNNSKGAPQPFWREVKDPSGQVDKEFRQKFGATIVCRFCQKKGHYESTCWNKFPEKRPKGKGKGGKGGAPTSQPNPQGKGKGKGEEPPNKSQKVCLFRGAQQLWTLEAQVNGKTVNAILDTGATISVVSKSLVSERALIRENCFPVQVANGQTLYTLGSTILTLRFDDKIFEQSAEVLDTNAFDAVLGLDFLSGNPRCGGILTQPPPEKLLFDGKLFPLKSTQTSSTNFQVFRIQRIFKKESYTLVEQVKDEALKRLEIPRLRLCVDLFANHYNNQESLYATRANSAFFYNWSKLGGEDILWANPPFSQMERVVTKLVLDPCQMVLVTPHWKGTWWQRILDKIVVRQFVVPLGTSLYKGDWDKKALPTPPWETVVSFLDTRKISVYIKECDLKTIRWVKSRNWIRNWDWGREKTFGGNAKISEICPRFGVCTFHSYEFSRIVS